VQDDEAEQGPQRRCIVTRETGERAMMIRFALSPDRLIVPDLAARLPGRGFWLSARSDVVLAAQSRGAFARAARGPVTLPPDLLSILRSGLTRRVVDHLGLARRAGQAVSGFAKARELVTAGRARLVVQASDGSDEECHRFLSGARDITAVRPLSAAALGAVFGRDHVVHVAIMPGRLAEALIADTARLTGLSVSASPALVGGAAGSGRAARGGADRKDGSAQVSRRSHD
jgi:predicted RNA-binding protein YlxR (DUF448 family)